MMRTRQTTTTLEDQRIPVRVKLAAAWTSVMFLYVYVDILAFFKPGVVPDILAGKVWEFDVSQTLLTTFLALMAIPIFMVWRASHISDSGPNKVPFEMEEHRCGRSAGNSLRSSSLKRFVL
jgi:hypothetical protein